MAHRPLLRPRLLHAGLRTDDLRVRTGARVARRSSTSSRPTGCSSTASSSTATARRSRPSTRPPRRCWPRSPRPATPTSTRAVKAARRAYDRVWSRMSGAERGQVPVPDRPDHPGARPRARRPGVDRQRQADQGVARRRRAARRRALLLLRRLGRQARVRRLRPDPQPLGVAGQVIPWNFPLLMLAWKIAPALACGNTVVLKPAETTPLTALLFAEICQQADLPPGVVNIVTGAGDTGQALVEHPDVDKVAFTGSTEVGKAIARAVAGTDKKVTLELGGKAANIVFDDAPLDQAVEGIVNGIFFNQGHVCCAGSRLLVQESRRRRGAGPAEAPDGDAARRRPARQEHRHRRDQLRRAARQDPRAVRRSARPRAPSAGRPPCELPDQRLLVRRRPIFTGVSQAHRIAREEIFGPVLSVLTFRTPAEAVEKANNTPYGLSAGVWTDKGSRILWMADQLRAGVVWANTFNRFDPTSPVRRLQGVGYGREGGRHGLEAYLADDTDRREPHRRPQDLQALHRRRRSRASSRAAPTWSATPRAGSWPTPRRRPARTPATPWSPPARRSAAGPARRRTTAARSLYRVAEVLEGRRDQFEAELARREGVTPRAARAEVDAAIDRLGLVRRLGRQDRPGAAAPTRSPGRTSTSRRPSRPASSPSSRRSGPLLGLVSVVAPADRHRQHRRRGRRQRAAPADRRSRSAEVLATSDVPGRRGQRAHRPHGRDRARGWPRTWTSTRIDLTGVDGRRAGRATWRWRPPTTSSGYRRPAPDRTGSPSPAWTG